MRVFFATLKSSLNVYRTQNKTLNLWLIQLRDLGKLWEIQTMCVRHSCMWECGFLGLLILAMRSEEYAVLALSRSGL